MSTLNRILFLNLSPLFRWLDPSTGDLRPILQRLYSDVYVETVAKNPLAEIGEPITCDGFVDGLEEFIQGLSFF